ncbi:HNH endonuclease signature motif containing protein [Streptomyces sp. NPDC021098]|uniref:HNH endonuclease signature motif containing protein n=1 Tax=unclassified Streptomyces TaxID=2593676 RepID=UPI0037887451
MEAAKKLIQGNPGECWRLPDEVAIPNGNGYVRIYVERKRWFAHRLAYTMFVGPIPDGLVIDHACHNQDSSCPGGLSCLHRQCVNPAHLEAVTQAENSLRGLSFAAANARKETCPEGHSLVDRKERRPKRYCPICRMKQRIARGETSGNTHWKDRVECVNGHPFDTYNTRVETNAAGQTRRRCRACERERDRARALRKRAERLAEAGQ